MAVNNNPMYLIGTWGLDERLKPVDESENAYITDKLLNTGCDFLIGGYKRDYVVICTFDVVKYNVVTTVGGSAFSLPRKCPDTCAWVSVCNASHVGKQYVLYLCNTHSANLEVIEDITSHQVVRMWEESQLYESEIQYYLALSRPVTLFSGKLGATLEPISIRPIDCYRMKDVKHIVVSSKRYHDMGDTIRYRICMYTVSDPPVLPNFDNFEWRTDADSVHVRNECKRIMTYGQDVIVYIVTECMINDTRYIPCKQPCGPLLQAFAGILTPDQIAMYGWGGPSDEPTYDADDTASDDDYGSDPEIVDYNDDYDLGEYD